MSTLHIPDVGTFRWIGASALLVAALIGVGVLAAGTPFEQATEQELAPMGERSMQEALAPGSVMDDYLQQKMDAKTAALPAQF